jgi:hypothetical protein
LQKQMVELLQQRSGSASLIIQTFTLSTVDLPLHAVFVETAHELVQIWTKVNPMKPEPPRFPETRRTLETITQRPGLDVLAVLFLDIALQWRQQTFEGFRATHKGLAMIGKRKRHPSSSRKPTIDAAKDDTICQLSPGCRGRLHKWLITVRTLQCFEPPRGVKYGGIRMP